MKFTRIPGDTFKQLVFNAGIIISGSGFDPDTGAVTAANILYATSGGMTFNSNPTYRNDAVDMDNVPENTFQLMHLQSFDPTLSGTALTVTPELVKKHLGAADIDSNNAAHIVPRSDLTAADFTDIWFVADYSDKNTGANAGFVAVHIMHALNTTGFQLQTGKDEKGQFSFEYHGHYDLTDMDTVPFEVYVQAGSAADTTLSALSITGVTLSPTFSASTTAYTASTTDDSNVVTATASASGAAVTIKNGTTTVTSGSAATWSAGTNTITVTVTNGTDSTTYTVTVTKGA